LYPLPSSVSPRAGLPESASVSLDQFKAIKDLLATDWKVPDIANVLGLSIEDVDRARLSVNSTE
jgi:hypothetical protein